MAKKNQKYRKQKQRKNFPWLFVALGGGLLILAAILFANQSGGDSGGTPSIVVDQSKIDYGYVKSGESTTIESSVFMMHPGMDGKHDYAVHLKTNDPQNPDLVVHVSSDWGP